MNTLSLSDCDVVGGGTAYAAATLLIVILVNSDAIGSFCSGFLDGYHSAK